ncbi:MAG TPA: DinB family protein [Bacteroidia bacterium]|nr:DinB family protein [Bacteroidia bacterium]
MTELQRLRKLFSDHFDGSPWLDVTIMDTLKDIPASKAAKKIENFNTIWQIVNHMIAWRETNLKRIKGEILPSPQNNFFEEVKDTSEEAWQVTLKKLERSQHNMLSFLSLPDDSWFEKIYIANNNSYYEHLQGILQHDAYHLGQIVLLKKII